MGYAADVGSEQQPLPFYDSDGWYLLRRNVILHGKSYRAGTLVECVHGEWFVQMAVCESASPVRRSLPIDGSMVCKTPYGGVSLYEIWRVGEGLVYARPVLSDVSPHLIDPMDLNVVLIPGQSRVCVQFGRCFLPLELFKW